LNLHLIDTGPQTIITRTPDDLISFADHDFRLTFTVTVQADAHAPTPDPLSLDKRVRRDVEVLNSQTIASAAPAAPIGANAIRRHGKQHQRK
jgi:hypothetical protein